MRIIVTGAAGQLGKEITAYLDQNTLYEVFPLVKKELDITNEKMVRRKITEINPDWIVHCAAYTNVDEAEVDGKNICWSVNKDGASYIAKAAAFSKSKVIYISTDYVFDGRKQSEYQENDETNPLNEYGASKLAGEKEILGNVLESYIIRTSWVFGKFGNNFVYTILNLAKTINELKVVNDQLGRPTFAKDLAAFIAYIIKSNPQTGIYHFANENTTTWFNFAKKILKDREVQVVPVSSKEFIQKAVRPKHAILSLKKTKAHFNIPTWEDSLQNFMSNSE